MVYVNPSRGHACEREPPPAEDANLELYATCRFCPDALTGENHPVQIQAVAAFVELAEAFQTFTSLYLEDFTEPKSTGQSERS